MVYTFLLYYILIQMIIVICGVVWWGLHWVSSIKYVNFFYCVPKINSASKKKESFPMHTSPVGYLSWGTNCSFVIIEMKYAFPHPYYVQVTLWLFRICFSFRSFFDLYIFCYIVCALYVWLFCYCISFYFFFFYILFN